MANSRKLLFALTVILVATITASAQVVPPFRCEASTAVPPLLRGEGIAELVGDVILTCRDGSPTPLNQSVPRVNIQIFLNTNVTSRILSGSATEALLLVDDPPPTAQNDLRTCKVGETCSLRGIYQLGNPATWQGLRYGEPGAVDGAGTPVYNIFQGSLTQSNSIAWWGVPIDPPGTQGVRVLRIKNVRAYAKQLWSEGALVPTALTMTITISGETSISLYNPLQIVGYVQQGLTISWRTGDGGSGLASGGATFYQCKSENSDLAGDPTKSFSTTAFRIRFNEGFATAFKKRTVTTSSTNPTAIGDQPTPNGVDPAAQQLYNTETGFFNSTLTDLQTAGPVGPIYAGLADHGTRLRVVFKDVPADVKVFVGTRASGTTEGTVVHLITPADPVKGTGPYVATQPSSTNPYAIAPVAISGGIGYATWEVVETNPLVQGYVEVPVVIAYKANPAAGLPGLGTAKALATFAPLFTYTTAQTWIEPVPRFAESGSDRAVFVITPCITNLLFPYVYSDAAWDTGIAIANTSKDIWGTSVESGACTLNFFGESAGGGAAPPAITTPVIPGGSVWTYTLSAGGTGASAVGSFKGYIIAQCRFRFAHGMAFISDMGASKVAHGYLALVMDSPSTYRTSFTGESLGQ